MASKTYNTPGVYVEEIATLPASIAEVETAIPAFIGYTEKGKEFVPVRITSLVEYQLYFGSARAETDVAVDLQPDSVTVSIDRKSRSGYVLYYAMRLYFGNGGGPCYVVPAGNFIEPTFERYQTALEAAGKEDEPTLLVFPDAPFLIRQKYPDLIADALSQASLLGDRFVIIDVLSDDDDPVKADVFKSAAAFRNLNARPETLKYGAAYFPSLNTSIPYTIDLDKLKIGGRLNVEPAPAVTGVTVEPPVAPAKKGSAGAQPAADFNKQTNADKNRIKQQLKEVGVELYPSAAIAGIYAATDNARGVWKAPANTNIAYVQTPVFKITDDQQNSLNIDIEGGKSINAIRSFVGMGTKVWGARTLAGNDNEWRYVNVRRFFNMVEESVKKSTHWAVFEPNEINTWTKVRAMIENYLIIKWKDGALAGAKPNDAYYVRVGLNQTMTAQDVLEGRMIIEIGLAVVRPAEFIVLRFAHKLQTS